ncbi:hypothetical protein AMS58_17200 [Pseudoalteromonas porphyrae]|uniref:Dienelactone hydrolase domain-containing protein n=1 Tax=Pseudoalteromonas neustonica TaxID=1840331 RepID=A0ABU9U361_9GAMM|nr:MULTISPECIES: hypothetical protein [Pseudoalteromonas]KPH93475.1 hypothetical protein AMS58_17200 [Pseudoalteromonas porphyrae]NMR26973.1 hypothetical protein [Pseudoalteromonas sp. NEC-BIFX-2020_015]
MNYIIVSDIFGKTSYLTQFAQALNGEFIIVDPYDAQLQPVIDEELQYQQFISQCGHDGYFQKLNKVLDNIKTDTTIIGFSAGGAAAWRSQACTKNRYIKKLVAFYPNQIRYNLNLPATIPCELIFPYQEAHFDVSVIITSLQTKANVSCFQCDYGHGFMNPLSNNFDNQGYLYFSKRLFSDDL